MQTKLYAAIKKIILTHFRTDMPTLMAAMGEIEEATDLHNKASQNELMVYMFTRNTGDSVKVILVIGKSQLEAEIEAGKANTDFVLFRDQWASMGCMPAQDRWNVTLNIN